MNGGSVHHSLFRVQHCFLSPLLLFFFSSFLLFSALSVGTPTGTRGLGRERGADRVEWLAAAGLVPVASRIGAGRRPLAAGTRFRISARVPEREASAGGYASNRSRADDAIAARRGKGFDTATRSAEFGLRIGTATVRCQQERGNRAGWDGNARFALPALLAGRLLFPAARRRTSLIVLTLQPHG